MIFLCYPGCSTCRKAKKWLEDKHVSFEERNIKEQNPSAEELREWLAKSGLPLKKFFNTGGMQYKALGLKDKLPLMTDEEQIDLLASDGMLVKRPVVITDELVLVGFREKDWEVLL